MSTNPNKLAFKGTPGPWITDKTGTKRGPIFMSCIHSQTGRYQTVVDVFGSTQVEMEHNMAMISAAPEAVEFIADLLYSLSCDTPKMDIPEMIHRGEEILKKAYNL